MSLVAQPEIDGQIIRGSPIILEIGSKHVLPLSPFPAANPSPVGEREPEVEVSAPVAAKTAGRWIRRRENSRKGDIAQ